jgi:hypothetical protein
MHRRADKRGAAAKTALLRKETKGVAAKRHDKLTQEEVAQATAGLGSGDSALLFQRLGISTPALPRAFSLNKYGNKGAKRRQAKENSAQSPNLQNMLEQNRREIVEDIKCLSRSGNLAWGTSGPDAVHTGLRTCKFMARPVSPIGDRPVSPPRRRRLDPWVVLSMQQQQPNPLEGFPYKSEAVQRPLLPEVRSPRLKKRTKPKDAQIRHAQRVRKHWQKWKETRKQVRQEVHNVKPHDMRRGSVKFSMHTNAREVVCNISAAPVIEPGVDGWIEIVAETTPTTMTKIKGTASSMSRLKVLQVRRANTL